ncbi:MAG: hypothetical protein OHK0029_38050 [Armatimonadaceae bacterium]
MATRTENHVPSVLATPLTVEIPTLEPGELERLSVQYAVSRDERLRDQLVLYHQRLVRSIAVRFLGAGEALEDLIQVGNIGLINALDRYDPSQGTRFSTYATPTILGEIKRHFRDRTTAIKVPRWLQEMHQAARRTSQILTQELGHSPSVADIADRLGVTEEEIVQALESGEAANLVSLDTHLDQHSPYDAASLLDLVGDMDTTLREFETYGDLRLALDALAPREREVISLRFFDEMSQAKIARKMNISQMHVSRLQQKALKNLREILSDEVRTPKRRRSRTKDAETGISCPPQKPGNA